MSEEEIKKGYYNCFQDLRRSATFYYLNPRGTAHKIFLSHAKKILGEINNNRAKRFLEIVSSLEGQLAFLPPEEEARKNFADKILTTGILMLS